MFVEERKKEVENGCLGRMHEGCAPPLLGREDDGKERGKGGEEWAGGCGEHKRKRISIGKLRSFSMHCSASHKRISKPSSVRFSYCGVIIGKRVKRGEPMSSQAC